MAMEDRTSDATTSSRGLAPHVSARFHGRIAVVWLIVEGDVASAPVARVLLRQLQRAQRDLPEGPTDVLVDLTGLNVISAELAVLLCVSARVLAVRNVIVTGVLRGSAHASASTETILSALPMVGPDEPREPALRISATCARENTCGWTDQRPSVSRLTLSTTGERT